jgi:signal transduction histidine kinase/ActR/RegA family two-component response regulator
MRVRLVFLFGGVMMAITVFLYLYFPLTVRREAEAALEVRAEEVTQMAAVFVASAVLFRQREDIGDQLRAAAKANDEVVYFAVMTADGELLEDQRIHRGMDLPQDPCGGSLGIIPQFQVYCAEASIRFPPGEQGRELGRVRAALHMGDLAAAVGKMRRQVGFVSAVILLIGLVASYLSMALFVRPLQKIADAAKRIAGGDLSVRVPVHGDDEVGILARAFNTMVRNLQGTQIELKQAYSDLEQILDNIPALVAVIDTEDRLLYINPAGVPDEVKRQALLGAPIVEFWEHSGVDEDAQTRLNKNLHRCIMENRITQMEVSGSIGQEGEQRTFLTLFGPILGSVGYVERVVGYAVEISELRRAEEALREREDQLRQAQKMEAVGRLAGGVAHDFNNLLTAVRGNTDLLLLEAEERGEPREELEEIKMSAERGARLTRQLLAFSRSQILNPELLDLNEVLDAIEKMIRRLIGEHIRVETSLHPSPVWITSDRGQVEQVIVNLALNAGDAMPDGGTLTLSTGLLSGVGQEDMILPEVSEGPFAVLKVQDTGVGMDANTQGRIFEPFFTTKPMGKGTGLGLATVYGIVQQSDGHLRVESLPGEGSTFFIYLPSTPPAEEGLVRPGEALEAGDGGDETILVVEDEELVRDLTSTLLRRQGYHVLAAEGPEDALRLSEGHPNTIHLLLTDLVMPEMNGQALARRVEARRPGLRVLFMSGYTDDEVLRTGISQASVHFLSKPFSQEELAVAVRRALTPDPVGAD